jgi:acid phosphatase
MEGMPGPGYLGEGSTLVVGQGPERLGEGKWDYVRKHNPFVHFDSIAHNGLRLLNIQDLSVFWADAEAGNLPQYSFLTPNILNDGHDTTLEYAAKWTDAFLTRLYKCDLTDTLVILTYDESATYEKPNQIVTLLLGGAVPQQLKGTMDDMFYTHYSKIATLENNWDLPNLGRYDVGANVFQFVADKTGYKNVQLSAEDMALVDLSVSNGGFLNNGSQGQIWLAAPSPNLQLVGAGGKGVADVVKAHWESEADNLSPYSGDGKIWKVGYVPQAPAPVS